MSEALERAIRMLVAVATDAPPPKGEHVEEPILALMRDGDQAEDLNDAIAHVASCADCRARLTEGLVQRRSVVVMAIEAPRGSQRELVKAAEETHALLLERGQGRWAAVVDVAQADKLKDELERPESSVVSRLAVGTPFELPVEDLKAARKRLPSHAELPAETGTDAAEVQAWAQVARKPRQRTASMPVGWILFAVVAIAGAMAVAYVLATR